MGLKRELAQRLVKLGDANLMMDYDHLLIQEFKDLIVQFYSDHIRTMKEMYGGTIARQKLNNIFSHLKSADLSGAVTENLKKMDSTKPEPDTGVTIQGFVFDLDGVIVDTAVHHFQSWKKLMKELGKDIADEDDHHTRGASRMESLEYLLDKYDLKMSREEKNELATRKNEYYLMAIEQITPDDLLPGSLQFLVDSRKAGLRLALGSASKNARGVLKKLGIEDKFDAVLDGYDAKESKPNPEIFTKACEALHLPPSSVVVFEDAQKGVKAALSAGCHCIGIGDPVTLHEADIVIPDLSAMTPQEIIETLV
jgi:beta-phosphoglucomutase